MNDLTRCAHSKVICINPFELIRKYSCDSCGEVMMCSCDEEFGRRFLPHQLSEGQELETRCSIPVTIGFQNNICDSCRGFAERAYPKAQIYGRTSKVERYYWREIYFETTRRYANWASQHGYKDGRTARQDHPDKYAAIRKEVVGEIKDLHNSSPKYTYQEKSQEQIIRENRVDVVRLDGVYVESSDRGAKVSDGGEFYSPEEFTALHYRRLGYETLFVESTPFHALFAIFMWLLIQDSQDPLVRLVGFGDRMAYNERRKGEPIWTFLPEDFGTPGYAKRRADGIKQHLAMIPHEKNGLLWTFDYWAEPSYNLRQYLWAHRPQDLDKARKLLSILSVDTIHRILHFLVSDYWRRYTGWPDLLIHKSDGYFFAEVKSSKDKLREDQKNWIQNNATELLLPFKLVKVHKKIG